MELPQNLKSLYRHWGLHTADNPTKTAAAPEDILWFINERISIWEQKTSGKAPPYTDDPILAQFRFCNIFRELDRQTIEIHTLLNPLRGDFPLWLLNMFYARMVARPETLRSVGLLTFDINQNKKIYEKLTALPRPRYGAPYVFPISVIQRSNTPTRELFIAKHLPKVMQKIAHEIQTWNKKSVYDGAAQVLPLFGFRLHFLWTETLIDVAYQFPEYIDLFKRFPIGPGAAPTFQILAPGNDGSWLVEQLAAARVPTSITYESKPIGLSAENWEGIGCEYRKYINLKNGKGRRRLFRHPSASSLF